MISPFLSFSNKWLLLSEIQIPTTNKKRIYGDFRHVYLLLEYRKVVFDNIGMFFNVSIIIIAVDPRMNQIEWER